MSVGILFFIGWSLLMVIISVVFFIWGKRSGQFKDIESAKYTMMEDREPLPWPGREGQNAPAEPSKTPQEGGQE